MYKSSYHRVLSSLNHIYLKQQHKLRTCLPGGHPAGVMVELCNVCNIKCILCPTGNMKLMRNTGFMDPDLFRRIVDELDDTYTRDLIPAMWGESLLHPHFIELMKYARRKTWRISLSTNGNKAGDEQYFRDLVDTGIDEIVCAVDGHDQESYEAYRRGGKLQIVHDFLRKIRVARDAAGASRPFLVAQVHISKANEDSLDAIRQNIGPYVDSIRTKKLRMFFTETSEIKAREELRERIRPDDSDKQFLSKGRPECSIMLYSININWEGEVIACCKDPSNILRMGSMRNQSLRSILNSKKYKEARQKLLRGEYWEDICRTCYLY